MPTGRAGHFGRQNEGSGVLFAVISSYLQNFSYLGRILYDVPGTGIAGADFVRSRGGRVVTLPLVLGLSTTAILNGRVGQ